MIQKLLENAAWGNLAKVGGAITVSGSILIGVVSFGWRMAMAPTVSVEKRHDAEIANLSAFAEDQKKVNAATVNALTAVADRLSRVESDSLTMLRLTRLAHVASQIENEVADLSEQMATIDTKVSRVNAGTEAIRRRVRAPTEAEFKEQERQRRAAEERRGLR